MYRNTRFGELMKGLPRGVFDKLVNEQQSDKHNKGFRSWDQLLAMIYGQLSNSRSLRELEISFNNRAGHHYHLGTRPIKRSTLADANSGRDWRLYEALCQQMLQRVHGKVKQEVGGMLYLLDSTPIPLKGRGYDDWASQNRIHRTQGLKLHMLYALEQEVPVYSQITAPNVTDIEDARGMAIEAGATYVFDKGYCDYNWWHRLDEQRASFVTRFKRNAALETVRTLPIPEASRAQILADEEVRLSNRHPGGGRVNRYQKTLRRISVVRDGIEEPLVLATNDFKRSAQEIADLYKARWQVELLFKWLKQNLKIKKFLGRSENAVRTQIYIAIITYLLVWLYRHQQGLTETLKQCTVLLSSALFQRPETEYQIWQKRRRRQEELMARQGVLL